MKKQYMGSRCISTKFWKKIIHQACWYKRPFRQMAVSQESLKRPYIVEENTDPILRD